MPRKQAPYIFAFEAHVMACKTSPQRTERRMCQDIFRSNTIQTRHTNHDSYVGSWFSDQSTCILECFIFQSPPEAPSAVTLEHQETQITQSLRSHVHRGSPAAAYPEGPKRNDQREDQVSWRRGVTHHNPSHEPKDAPVGSPLHGGEEKRL